VVDDRIGSGRRRLLHSRAADALLRRPAPVAAGTVARHLHEGGRLGEAAHWYWQAAVEARALFAHVEALGHVEQARSLGHPAAAAHFVAGELLTTLGRYPEALAAYEAAAATFVVGDAADLEVTRLAAVEHRLADVHHRLGDYGVAEAHARAALDLLQTVAAADRALVARVVADQALIAYRRGDDARAQGTAERALDLAAGIDDAAAAAQALDVLGMVALRRNDLAAAERFLEDSLARARPLPDPSSAVAALNNLSRLYAQRSDLTAAVAAAREALAIGNSHGDRHRAAALHTNLADLLHATNQGDEAMTHLKRAATLFAGIDEEGERRPEIWKLVQW
jgi:tetratricopeptide (TPR) repeat protein